MKRITVMLAVGFDLYQEARNYITEILTILLVRVINWWRQTPLRKKLRGSGWFGKVAKMALAIAPFPPCGGAYVKVSFRLSETILIKWFPKAWNCLCTC